MTSSVQSSVGLLKSAICEQTARICCSRFGDDLRAIVLTGSVARDEGTFIEQSSGWKLLGDADFFLVFHDASRMPAQNAIDAVAREVSTALSENRVKASIGLR